MTHPTSWQLFNIDSLLEEIGVEAPPGSDIDLWVAALAFKNFDFVEKRRPFLIECITYSTATWASLCRDASRLFWVIEAGEAIAVFDQTEHCGCVRTYRLGGVAKQHDAKRDWRRVTSEQVLYEMLDIPSVRGVFDVWHAWSTQSTKHATELADGRRENTTAGRSLIFTNVTGCAVCGSQARAYANTTIGAFGGTATLIHLPVCDTHLALARAEPNVLTYLAKIFSLDFELDLPRTDAIPDELIPFIHAQLAGEMGGTVGDAKRHANGWLLEIVMDEGWLWRLRMRTFNDYAYMLFKPGQPKEVYRADSAPDHPELTFFPNHEHTHPGRKKKDTVKTSYLYGLPLFDVKRLRDISREFGAL